MGKEGQFSKKVGAQAEIFAANVRTEAEKNTQMQDKNEQFPTKSACNYCVFSKP